MYIYYSRVQVHVHVHKVTFCKYISKLLLRALLDAKYLVTNIALLSSNTEAKGLHVVQEKTQMYNYMYMYMYISSYTYIGLYVHMYVHVYVCTCTLA